MEKFCFNFLKTRSTIDNVLPFCHGAQNTRIHQSAAFIYRFHDTLATLLPASRRFLFAAGHLWQTVRREVLGKATAVDTDVNKSIYKGCNLTKNLLQFISYCFSLRVYSDIHECNMTKTIQLKRSSAHNNANDLEFEPRMRTTKISEFSLPHDRTTSGGCRMCNWCSRRHNRCHDRCYTCNHSHHVRLRYDDHKYKKSQFSTTPLSSDDPSLWNSY